VTKSQSRTQSIIKFEERHGEPLIVSAITAAIIGGIIPQISETRFAALLVACLFGYTLLVFAFEGVVWKVLH